MGFASAGVALSKLVNGIPVSLVWFVLTGLVYLAQLSPQIGIFLMLFGAGLWPVLFINIGFIGIIFEVVVRRLHWVWLALPLAWFGGYALLTMESHRALDRLEQQLSTANAGVSLPFDQAAEALAFQDDSGRAADLVQRFDVPQTYTHQSEGLRAFQLGGPAPCELLRKERHLFSPAVMVSWLTDGSKPGHPLVSGLCLISYQQQPGLPLTQVSATTEQFKDWLLPYRKTTLTLTKPDGTTATLVTATASPLYWWPAPVLGCALNSAAPSWDCFHGFRRTLRFGVGAGSRPESFLIAEALGLKRVPYAERQQRLAADTADFVRSLRGDGLQKALQELDAVLAAPLAPSAYWDQAGLGNHPDLIDSRMDKIVKAHRQMLTGGHRSKDPAKAMQGLLSAAKPETFQRLAPGVLASLLARKDLHEDMLHPALVSRAGDLGKAGLPLIERYAFEIGPKWSGAGIWGLCRAGAAAAPYADRLAAELVPRGKSERGERYPALYATLLRLGRTDLLDRDPDRGAVFMGDRYQKLRQTISPASGPDVCKPW